jgi:hypothetical protein
MSQSFRWNGQILTPSPFISVVVILTSYYIQSIKHVLKSLTKLNFDKDTQARRSGPFPAIHLFLIGFTQPGHGFEFSLSLQY